MKQRLGVVAGAVALSLVAAAIAIAQAPLTLRGTIQSVGDAPLTYACCIAAPSMASVICTGAPGAGKAA